MQQNRQVIHISSIVCDLVFGLLCWAMIKVGELVKFYMHVCVCCLYGLWADDESCG